MKVDLQAMNPSLLMHKLGLHALIFDEFERNSLEIGKPGSKGYVGDKRAVLDALVKSVQDDNFRKIYEDTFNLNWLGYLEKTGALVQEARTGSRFLSGLSYGAAMHVGFSLHHTYGVPYIPGSTVKGACKAIAEREASEMDDKARAEARKSIRRIYGDEDGCGQVIFLDAFPKPLAKKTSPMLELDVITPHHTKANSGETGYDSAPDIEEPVPVEFAVVPEGVTYCFAFICQSEEYSKIVLEHWKEACDEGFGAKTSSGYGWFVPQEQPEETVKKISPETVLDEFRKNVESNKSILINKLSDFVNQIDDESIPEQLRKEMATFLVTTYGPKNLKARIKKGNATAIRLEQMWKA